MNNIQVFNNPEFGDIRTVEIDGEPWFVGKDVADNLGYQNGSRDINRHVDEDDKQKMMLFDGNQKKETIIINESGLYALILGSKLPSAKRFKHWVTSEVLPSIRRTGAYIQQETKAPEVSPVVLVKCAEIMAGLPGDNRQYVINILKNIVPDIDKCVAVVPAEVTKAPRLSQAGYTVPFNGSKLRDMLHTRNISIAEFANLVGVRSDRIYRYCDGRSNPGTEVRNRMCAALEVPEGYFNKRTRRKR